MSSSPERALAALLLLLAACGGGGGGGGGDGTSPPDGAPPDAGRPSADGPAACAGTAGPGPRAAFQFIRPPVGTWELVLVDLSGPLPACPVPVTPDPVPITSGNTVIEWAPDSLSLAFAADHGIAIADTSGERPGPPVRVSPDGISAGWDMTWSADSRWLAFDGDDAGGTRHTHLVEVVDGVPGPAVDVFPRGRSGGPSWRPDASGLVVYTDYNDPAEALRWVPLLGGAPGTPEVITTEDVMATGWSPDGDQLAITIRGATRSDLFVSSFATGAPGALRRVSNHGGSGHVYDFVWSPDGRRLLYRVSGTPSRLFVADTAQAEPVARRVDDPDLGPVQSIRLGWVSDTRIHYAGGSTLYLVDLAGGIPGASQPASPGMEPWGIARDHRAMVVEDSADPEAPWTSYWVSLEPDAGPPRLISDTEGDSQYSFTGSGRVVYRVELPTDPGAPRHIQFLAFDPEARASSLLFETDVMSDLVLPGPADQVLLLEDERDRPPLLYHADLAAGAALEQVLSDPPFDWTFGTVAFAPPGQ